MWDNINPCVSSARVYAVPERHGVVGTAADIMVSIEPSSSRPVLFTLGGAVIPTGCTKLTRPQCYRLTSWTVRPG